jgi:hypothetical protein
MVGLMRQVLLRPITTKADIRRQRHTMTECVLVR